MTQLTIEFEDDVARRIEETARRAHKTMSEWVKDRVVADLEGAPSLEQKAKQSEYPPGWNELYGLLADDESFAAPTRGATRPLTRM